MLDIAHFWNWDRVAVHEWVAAMRQFADCGHRDLVITENMALRIAFNPGFAQWLKQKADDAGVRFTGVHAPWGEWDLLVNVPGMAETKRHVHTTLLAILPEVFGIRHYVMHQMSWRGPYRGTFDDAERQVGEELEPLLRVAEKHGMVVALENGWRVTDNPEALLRYMRRYAGTNVGCCMDVGHLNVVAKRDDYDFYAYLEALLPHIVVCHLHDNDGKGDQHLLPGDGRIDWTKLMPILVRAPRLQSLQNEGGSMELSIPELCRKIDTIRNY